MANGQADYLIKGGLAVSGSGIARQDVLVRGEKIAAVGDDLSGEQAQHVIDASGTYVLPGIVDAHNHPVYSDKIDTMSVAGAYGGVTTVIPFIRNDRNVGGSMTTVDAVKAFIDEAEETSVLDFGVHAILVGDDDVDHQVPDLIGMGVISFKMFMTYSRRGMMMPDEKMLTAMALAAQDGGIAMVHAENGYCIDHLIDGFIADEKTSAEYFAQSHPRALEAEAATRAATYAGVTDSPLYVVHISAREMLDVLSRFKGEGVRLYGETCPQYLVLTNEMMLMHGALAKIGPPLREREDNEAMWRGLDLGLLDTVASDFCGLKRDQKFAGGMTVGGIEEQPAIRESSNIFEGSYGGNWIEQMLPVVYEEGVNLGRITLPRLVQVVCENPAKIFGLYPKKGAIQPGSDADIVLFDPSIQHTLSAEVQHTNADFTMFEGKEVLGKPVWSMQRGDILIEDGELRRPTGQAKYLPGDVNSAAYAPNGHPVT